jgi:hypothetical protein
MRSVVAGRRPTPAGLGRQAVGAPGRRQSVLAALKAKETHTDAGAEGSLSRG